MRPPDRGVVPNQEGIVDDEGFRRNAAGNPPNVGRNGATNLGQGVQDDGLGRRGEIDEVDLRLRLVERVPTFPSLGRAREFGGINQRLAFVRSEEGGGGGLDQVGGAVGLIGAAVQKVEGEGSKGLCGERERRILGTGRECRDWVLRLSCTAVLGVLLSDAFEFGLKEVGVARDFVGR